ncbi:MAG: NUDIX domain-containing protein [bacterium]|nr:NUDIX domain-containing protein [bacterium]
MNKNDSLAEPHRPEPRPEGYDPRSFTPFAVTVDIVLMTVVGHALKVLLIQRGQPPYEGAWALPGGFVQPEEDLADAAARELAEETGIEADRARLLQLGAYGRPGRDPRMRVVTVAYGAVVARLEQAPRGGGDAAHAELVAVADVQSDRLRLAFDHRLIVDDAVARLRSELDTGDVATGFCPPEFTIRELREVYEAILQTELDSGNFIRKVTRRDGFISPTGGRVAPGDRGGRPATLWRAGDPEGPGEG